MAPERPLARRLRNLVEPISANVYFAPEAHGAYKELGLSYIPGYFCSRSACMGQLPGEVVAAAFAVFNPETVVPAFSEGWSQTDAAAILEARRRGATASLSRLLGDALSGIGRATELLQKGAAAGSLPSRPIFAGLSSLEWPGDPVGDLWRAADLVREHRGDTHNCAWVAAGVGPVEITILTELWWGLPLGAYVHTRGWTKDQVDEATTALRDRGLVSGDQLTEAGRQVRESIEEHTDSGEATVVAEIGDDIEELFEILHPWAKAIVDQGGYPADPSSLGRR